VKELLRTVLPLVYAWAMLLSDIRRRIHASASYADVMREKDFVELYLPTFKTMLSRWRQ
jgi:hypothetical protein